MSEIRDEDLLVDLYDPHPRTDGINVGADMGVRVMHIPTGIIVESSSERSQLQNKAACLEMLMEELGMI
jgi:peptide chain release factor 2